MDYKQLYAISYETYFSTAEQLVGDELKTFKKEGFTFNYTYNEMHKKMYDRIHKLTGCFKTKEVAPYFKLFNDRYGIFQENPIDNIIEKRIIPLLKKNNELDKIDLSQFVYDIAKLNAAKEAARLFQNNNKLFEHMFELNDFRKFELIEYRGHLEQVPLFIKLNNKLYPPAKISTSIMTNSTSADDEFLSVKEVAKLTNYAVATIYDKKHKRQIPFYKNGAKLQFKKSEILQWMEKGKGITSNDLEDRANEYLLKNS